MGLHNHLTCIVCGARLPKGWLVRGRGVPRRWGYQLETSGWGKVRKTGAWLVAATPPDQARKWWGTHADEMAVLVVRATTDLFTAGWRPDVLRTLAELVRRATYIEAAYSYAKQYSPREVTHGPARVGPVTRGELTLGELRPTAKVGAVTWEE